MRRAIHRRNEALLLGQRLGNDFSIVSSPVLRAVQTADAIAQGSGRPHTPIVTLESLVNFRIADADTYQNIKTRLGWAGLMLAWMDGSLAEGTLVPCHQVALSAIKSTLAAVSQSTSCRSVAVTHDFVVMALMASLRGVRATAVPYLGGIFVCVDEAQSFAHAECRS